MESQIQPASRGRKAVRTVTAPSLSNMTERGKFLSLERPHINKPTPNMPSNGQSLSLYELHTRTLSPTSSLYRPLSRTEIHSKYSLHQQLKETMESIKPGNPTTPPQKRHRRELTRCWSRERIIRNEVIIAIKPAGADSTQLLNTSDNQTSTGALTQLSLPTGNNVSNGSSNGSLFAPMLLSGKLIPIRTEDEKTQGQELQNGSIKTVANDKEKMCVPLESKVEPGISPPAYTFKDETAQDTNLHSQQISTATQTIECSLEQLTKPFEQTSTESQIIKRPVYGDTSRDYGGSLPDSVFTSAGGSNNSFYSTAPTSPNNSPTTSLIDDDTEELPMTSISNNRSFFWSHSVETDDGTVVTPASVAYFQVVIERDSTGYGIRVCGYKPVSVHSVREGGSADKAGIQPGDQIIKVNGLSVGDMTHDDVVKQIRAKPTVSFLLRRQRYGRAQSACSLDEHDNPKPFRLLTAKEDPVLRTQSRRFQSKRRSSRDFTKGTSGSAGVIKRRARMTVSMVESLPAGSSPPQMESVSDSAEQYTDEELESPRRASVESLHTNVPANENAPADDKSAKLPPQMPTSTTAGGTVLLRSRPSLNRANQSIKGRPTSVTPNLLIGAIKRNGCKEISPLLEQQKKHSRSLKDVRLEEDQLVELPPSTDMVDVHDPSQVTPPEAPAQPSLPFPSGHLMGRNFDDESDDDTHTREELTNLSNLFNRSSVVLNNPERTGVFLNYLLVQNMDLAPSLFYLVNRYYQRVVLSSKELSKEYKRLCYEIFSTFMHPKSPLHLDLPAPVLQEISQQIRQPGSVDQCFAAAIDPVLNMVQTQLDKLCREIQYGITTWRPQESINLLRPRSYEEQLTIFELCLSARLQALVKLSVLEPPGAQGSDPTIEYEKVRAAEMYQAVTTCLVTAYRLFSLKGAADLADSGSVSRSSSFARSVENLASSTVSSGVGNITGSIAGGLAGAGSSLWFKLPYFSAKMKQKSHGHLLMSRKQKYMQKNHVLQERALEEITPCSVCSDLIWGLSPQSLSCTYCDLNVHQKCRSGIREVCTKEGRKSLSSLSAIAAKAAPTEAAAPAKVVTGIPPTGPTAQDTSGNSTPATDTGLVRRAGSHTSIPTSLSNNPSFSSVDFYQRRSQASLTDDGDSVTSQKLKSTVEESVDGDTRHVLRMKTRYDSVDVEGGSSILRRESMASLHSLGAGQEGTSDASPRTPASEAFPELVTTNWSDDPEMIASESFEAAVELRYHFPNYQMPAKGIKSEDYIRTLCLLEFHQKTQYMVRHLKQYEYLLIRPWPAEHQILAQELCLDRIPKLIDLFRSLVNCIDRTKTPQGYVGMAEAVLAWLTDNSKANLKTWAQHCQALSCTNMLDCVSKWVRDYAQRHPEIVRLLQTRHNKFVLIDGLKHMRILYFNLPLIANSIVKDLEKKTKSYKAEAQIWKKIHEHLASLPQTIDDVCMPLVKKINSGQLQSSLDRKDAIFRQPNATVAPYQELLLNFPRMLFRYWVAAHAEVAVDRLTVTSANKVNHDYVRERTDILIILLHSALLLLVKDNERYVLRAFKATREHTGGATVSGSSIGSVVERSSISSYAERIPLASASFSGPVTSTSNQSMPHTASLGSFSGATMAAQLNVQNANPGGGLVNTVANMAGASISERPSGSGSLKLAPILLLHKMFTSCGEKYGGEHLLNIVSIEPPVLVRVLFFQEAQRQNWFTLLKEHSSMVTPFSAAQQQSNIASVRESKAMHPEQLVTLRHPRISEFSETSEGDAHEEEEGAISEEKGPVETGEEIPGEFIEKQPQRTAPVIEHSDSASSMEEEISPLDRVHMSINACNQMNQQMRRDLCETLRISETEFDNICKSLQLDEAPSLDQLLLLQVDIMHNWLCFLSQTYSKTIRRRDNSRTLRARTVDQIRPSADYTLLPEAGKRPSLFSLVESFRTAHEEGAATGSTEESSTKTTGFPISTLQTTRSVPSSVSNVDQTGSNPSLYPTARQLGVNVQDSRRSRRRTVRSSSMIEREIGPGPDRYSMIQMWQLVSQMANTIRQYTKLISKEPHFGEPLRRSISDPDTPISSRLSSMRQPKGSEEKIPKDPSEVASISNLTVTTPDKALDKTETDANSDQNRTYDLEYLESTNSVANEDDQSSGPREKRHSEYTMNTASEVLINTRDSGCLPSATDEDEETQELTQSEFLDPVQRSSTPTDESEMQRTPTANTEMLDLPTSEETSIGIETEPSSFTSPTEVKTSGELEGQTENLSSQKLTTAEILVARNDSQKSTTSSGFVED